MSDVQYIDGWPQPYTQLDSQPYWQALTEERLTYQHCDGCDQAVWPAHSYCPHCGAEPQHLQWRTSTGRGSVYSYSTVMRGPTPAWGSIAPYTVGFIEMEERYFLFSQIDCHPGDVRIGDLVQVRFIQRGRQVLPVFDLTRNSN